jgi:hypothetical protein
VSTDKIQTKLYERADGALKTDVETMIATVRKYFSKSGFRRLRVAYGYNVVITKGDGHPLDEAVRNVLKNASIAISYDLLLESLSKDLFEAQQVEWRKAEVEAFFEKLDRLREDVDDLQNRVE